MSSRPGAVITDATPTTERHVRDLSSPNTNSISNVMAAISSSSSAQARLLSPDKRLLIRDEDDDDAGNVEPGEHDRVFHCMLDAQKERIEHLEQRLEQLEANLSDHSSASCSCEVFLYALLSSFVAILMVFAAQHYFKVLDYMFYGYRWDEL
eukprot:CAMPEP_0201525552 /NCGR_PEP_ID=MMETSP0161_2-20130828/28635_1 /ASSEMBLY_ACC=CAM_ASM_000251 /TAXON_ID=180227 /ORGANISM="Neoparamoeba aestuarina, Strain SoJaBio B1-5/56/2" /LENGTH=151 /DNA_ID=CAMNT_0047925525 /DNA_START=95 /DNA_END=550 /DNA_ORIENTATION=-